MPAPLLTLADAQEYAGADYSGMWLESIRQLAADAVAAAAPRPSPLTDDYLKSAKAAERQVGVYLWENRALYSNLTPDDVSISYTGWDAIMDTIAQTMPSEYMGYNVSRSHA